MKKASVTIRVPIFFDLDVEMNDRDYEDLLEEWDRSNFGRVKAIIENYVDMNSLDVPGTQERYGEPEMVDLRIFEEQEHEHEVECEIEVEPEDDPKINTIPPKGRPN